MPWTLWKILLTYALVYFKATLHAAMIWGPESDIASNDARLENLYPLEWKRLQALKERGKALCKS